MVVVVFCFTLQMEIDLAPFTNSSSDINGLLTTAPIIRHTEVHGPVFTTSTDPFKVYCYFILPYIDGWMNDL